MRSFMDEFCCPLCFADGYLRKSIPWSKEQRGTCSFCLSKEQPLKAPHELQMEFQPVVDLYCQGKGISLAKQIGQDWAIWSERIKSNARSRLLDAICGKTVSKRQYHLNNQKELEQKARTTWNSFSEELKHRNRFIHSLDQIPDLSVFERFMDQFRLGCLPEKLFRARINKDDAFTPFPIDEMKKPPITKAKSGRANPLGISYLYVSTTVSGAIHEVRPHIGAYVSVVEIHIKNPSAFYIVDLRFLDGTISPFGLDDLEAFSRERPLLKILDSEMSRAISPKRSELDYLPIQYLCESIKQQGADGIAYKSVACLDKDTYNLVFFLDDHIEYKNVECHYVSSNTIQTSPVNQN